MKLSRSILTGAAILALVAGTGTAANAETLGWSEDGTTATTMLARAAAKHTGKAEEKVINGTTNKRAYGKTTWSGVRHYTRARIEKGATVVTDSGRVIGTNVTQAWSPWAPWSRAGGGDPVGPGTARTYYGK